MPAVAMNRNPGALPGDTSQYLENVLPGFGSLSTATTGIIGDLLKGLPSPDLARTSNAYFGAASGMGPGSEFLRNRGYDLYNQQAQARQQTGIQDLLATLGGYSGTVVPTAGQSLQNAQFGQSLAEQRSEFGQNLELDKFRAMLQALGLGAQLGEAGFGGFGGRGNQPGQDASGQTMLYGFTKITNPDGSVTWIPSAGS